MKFSNTLLGLAVGLFASHAAALSLGAAHGQVVLGRPIDLVFDIHTDPGSELDVACVKASAQAGETQIDSSRLQITALPVVAGRAPSVRVRSSLVVLEPILTLRLVVGCSGVVSRSYDFFAEVPPAQAAQAAKALPLVIAPPPRATAAAAAAAPEPFSAALPPPPPKPKPKKPNQPPKKQPAPQAAEAAAPAAPRTSRLTVEPLGDWLAQATPAPLRLSPSLQELPQDAPSAQRAQAAALWQLLNISAQEVQQTQVRLQQQQAEIEAARASREKLQTTLTALQKQVDSMDVQRLPTALLYSLLALLVVICAALAWLWQRTRSYLPGPRVDSGWSNSEALRDKEHAYSPPLDAESPAPLAQAAQAAPSSAVPVVLTKTAAPAPAEMPVAAPLAADQQTVLAADLALVSAPAVATAAAAAVRMLNPEDLFDLQQQAEFFISVGEHDQAIEVMKQHIDENATASPLMYLELLRLYRSLGRSDDFKALRAQFQRYFNAVVPELSALQGGGRTLLDYPETAASIEAVWSDNAVLALLEGCIFCPAEGCSSTVEPFELPAYDDLLLLYAIARTIPADSRGAPPPRQRTTPYAVELAQSLDPVEPLESLGLVEPARLSPASLPALDDEVDFDLGPFLDVDLLTPVSTVVEPPVKPDAAPAPELPVLGNLIEYDTHLLSKAAMPSPVAPPQPSAPASAWTFDLDLDLSEIDGSDARELPPLTEGVVPALEVTPAPAADQPIGFGAVSDRFEARFDLEDDKGKPMDF